MTNGLGLDSSHGLDSGRAHRYSLHYTALQLENSIRLSTSVPEGSGSVGRHRECLMIW